MERRPMPGEIYRHFKNKLYQIVTVARHSETGEELVIYQALYGEFDTYARPLAMFVSEVDHEKYPAVTQKYRFARVEPTELSSKNDTRGEECPAFPRAKGADHPASKTAPAASDQREGDMTQGFGEKHMASKTAPAASDQREGGMTLGFGADHPASKTAPAASDQREGGMTQGFGEKHPASKTAPAASDQREGGMTQGFGADHLASKAAPAASDQSEEGMTQGFGEKHPASKTAQAASGRLQLDPGLMAFLETDSFEERCNILTYMKGSITDSMIDTMAVAVDTVIPEGNLEKRYDDLMYVLRTRQQYESGGRLR